MRSLNFDALASIVEHKLIAQQNPPWNLRRVCWAMSLSASVPLDATTRSPKNRHVPASKVIYLCLISVTSALQLKPRHQSSRIASHLNLTRGLTARNENMQLHRNTRVWYITWNIRKYSILTVQQNWAFFNVRRCFVMAQIKEITENPRSCLSGVKNLTPCERDYVLLHCACADIFRSDWKILHPRPMRKKILRSGA